MRRVDLTGRRFGSLVVKQFTRVCRKRVHWLCDCDCGQMAEVRSDHLQRSANPVKSCGCSIADGVMKGHRRRGHEVHGLSHTPEYNAWCDAKRRCTNPMDRQFADYGGRGITMYPEWQRSFAKFISHIGPKPGADLSLDRIDNNGNYEPGNVRWATAKQQQQNTRRAERAKAKSGGR